MTKPFLAASHESVEALEKRVAACESAIAEGKKQAAIQQTRIPFRAFPRVKFLYPTPRASFRADDVARAFVANLAGLKPKVEEAKPKNMFESLEVRIDDLGTGYLHFPAAGMRAMSILRGSQPWPYQSFDFKRIAKELRDRKTKNLRIIRYRKAAPMEHLTKWLTGLVNEHSPVMTITSDPGFVEDRAK